MQQAEFDVQVATKVSSFAADFIFLKFQGEISI